MLPSYSSTERKDSKLWAHYPKKKEESFIEILVYDEFGFNYTSEHHIKSAQQKCQVYGFYMELS